MDAELRSITGRRAAVVLAALVTVAFAFWRPLFGGGTLVSADIVASEPPALASRPFDYTPDPGPGDPINIHSHWGSMAEDVRAGAISWWDTDQAGGQPTFKGGLPPFNLLYLLVPTWFAPGLVAAVRALTAIGLAAGWLRLVGTNRVAALVGGLAYGFSGFMVGWMNWPQSSVAALAPGLLWAVEAAVRDPRLWRAVPIGLVTAAMVWSNFPAVTYYILLGTAAYAIVRIIAELRTRPDAGMAGQGRSGPPFARARGMAAVAGVAVLIALGAAAPHVVGFAEYIDWADTSQRVGNPIDSAAGSEYLLTAISPAAFGNEFAGPAYFGAGNWTEFQIHVGLSVVLLAALGAPRVAPGDHRRRSAVIGLAVVVALGVVVAYVGGPVSVAVQEIAGDQVGLATRAKVLISLGMALLAGLGADVWSRSWDPGEAEHVGRTVRWGLVGIALVAVALIPDLLDWRDLARGAGSSRQVLAWSAMPLIAGVAVVATMLARWRGWIRGPAVGWVVVGIVAFELLGFAMPVPTIADRDERLERTEAHEQVIDLLEPGERLGGEGRTFWTNTTDLHGIDDTRGQLLKSPGYQALLRAVDPAMLLAEGGGIPTYPDIAIGTDPRSPVWDAMAVGVWAQYNASIPPGEQVKPGVAREVVDPTLGPLTGTITVPEGGLRAVLFEVFLRGLPRSRIHVSLEVAGEVLRSTVDTRRSQTGFAAAAFAGEDLPPGEVGRVTMTVEGPADETMVAVDERGQLNLGTVAGGDDGLRLVRAGDVTLFERTTAHFARLHESVVVEPDPDAAAALIASGGRDRAAVVASDVDLPAGDGDPDLRVVAVDVDPGRVEVRTVTDRPALLVVAQNDYPGWTAEINGVDATIVTADATFSGIVVPEGDNVVVLRFRPRHLLVTTSIAMVTLMGALLILLRAPRTRSGPVGAG